MSGIMKEWLGGSPDTKGDEIAIVPSSSPEVIGEGSKDQVFEDFSCLYPIGWVGSLFFAGAAMYTSYVLAKDLKAMLRKRRSKNIGIIPDQRESESVMPRENTTRIRTIKEMWEKATKATTLDSVGMQPAGMVDAAAGDAAGDAAAGDAAGDHQVAE